MNINMFWNDYCFGVNKNRKISVVFDAFGCRDVSGLFSLNHITIQSGS